MSKEVRMLNEISKALGGAEHVQRKDILEEIAGLSDSLGPEQHILPPSQVDPETGLPTVEDPEEGAFYLVPSGEEEPNLYNEYIWTGDGWELFGSGGGGKVDTDRVVEITTEDFIDSADENGNIKELDVLATAIRRKWSNNTLGVTADGIYCILSPTSRVIEPLKIRMLDSSNVRRDLLDSSAQETILAFVYVYFMGQYVTAPMGVAWTRVFDIYSSAIFSGVNRDYDTSKYSSYIINWEYESRNYKVLPIVCNGTADVRLVGKLKNIDDRGTGVVEGNIVSNAASGEYAHAEGNNTKASGDDSHAEGIDVKASGNYSHAEGGLTTASSDYSHAEGNQSTASGSCSHAEGTATIAYGRLSHAEGNSTKAYGEASHAEGYGGVTGEDGNSGTGFYAHAEGYQTTASANRSHAEGYKTIASSDSSHSEGYQTTASGAYAHAEGNNTRASRDSSHSEGYNTTASGKYSHAEGNDATASGESSHAEGGATASGKYSHAEGNDATASGINSHAEGYNTKAQGDYSHAEGNNATASGKYSHAEGWGKTYGEASHAEGLGVTGVSDNPDKGGYSHAEGYTTKAQGNYSHAEGRETKAIGEESHAEGGLTTASGLRSHSEGFSTTASGDYSHAEGDQSTASGDDSHAEGRGTNASGIQSHAEGAKVSDTDIQYKGETTTLAPAVAAGAHSHIEGQDTRTETTASNAHAEGYRTYAKNANAHAEGSTTTASGESSHAEGFFTKASGDSSHAEGVTTTASGNNSHAEGSSTEASGAKSHAEGFGTIASGEDSHAEGHAPRASGDSSHAEGSSTTASGYNSHAEGNHTIANHKSQHVHGEYNISDPSTAEATERGNYVEIVGNGTADNARSNARTLDWSGNERLAGKLTVGADPTEDMDVATKQYVDENAGGGGQLPLIKVTPHYGPTSYYEIDWTYEQLTDYFSSLDDPTFISCLVWVTAGPENYSIGEILRNVNMSDNTTTFVIRYIEGATMLWPLKTGIDQLTIHEDGSIVKDGYSAKKTITLTASAWSSNTQTVSVAGVKATNTVLVTPAPASVKDWDAAYVICTAQGANSLTFTCDTVPENDISVNVVILG